MVKHETLYRVSEVHKPSGSSANGFARRDQAARSGVSKTGGCKPETSRSNAKDAQAAFRSPRPCRLERDFRYFSLLRRQFGIGQPLAELTAKEAKIPEVSF